MAAVTDLSWQQLSDAFGSQAVGHSLLRYTADAYGNHLFLDLVTLLGRDVAGLTETGVIEALLKLRELCVAAQATANTGKTDAEKLKSFPAATYSAASNSNLPITATITAKIPVALVGQARVTGTN